MNRENPHDQPELLLIGRIVGAFGWAGELKVWPETDFPDRFTQLAEVWIELPDGRRRKCRVVSVHVSERQIRIRLSEIHSKEEAAELLNALILIPHDDAVPLPEGRFYIHQILGLSVRSTTGENLGKIIDVLSAPGNDVYVTEKLNIPAVKEVVKEINLEQGIMVIDASRLEEE